MLGVISNTSTSTGVAFDPVMTMLDEPTDLLALDGEEGSMVHEEVEQSPETPVQWSMGPRQFMSRAVADPRGTAEEIRKTRGWKIAKAMGVGALSFVLSTEDALGRVIHDNPYRVETPVEVIEKVSLWEAMGSYGHGVVYTVGALILAGVSYRYAIRPLIAKWKASKTNLKAGATTIPITARLKLLFESDPTKAAQILGLKHLFRGQIEELERLQAESRPEPKPKPEPKPEPKPTPPEPERTKPESPKPWFPDDVRFLRGLMLEELKRINRVYAGQDSDSFVSELVARHELSMGAVDDESVLSRLFACSHELQASRNQMCGVVVEFDDGGDHNRQRYYEPNYAFFRKHTKDGSYAAGRKLPAFGEIVPELNQVFRQGVLEYPAFENNYYERYKHIPQLPSVASHPYVRGFFPGEMVYFRMNGDFRGRARFDGVNEDGTMFLTLENGRLIPRANPLDVLSERHVRNQDGVFNDIFEADFAALALYRSLRTIQEEKKLSDERFAASYHIRPGQANVGNCAVMSFFTGVWNNGIFRPAVQSAHEYLGWWTHKVTLPWAGGSDGVREFTLYPWHYLWPHWNRSTDPRDKRRWLMPVRGGLGYKVLEAAFNMALTGSAHRGKQEGHYPSEVLRIFFGENVDIQTYQNGRDYWQTGSKSLLDRFDSMAQVGIVGTAPREYYPGKIDDRVTTVVDNVGRRISLPPTHAFALVSTAVSSDADAPSYVTLVDPHRPNDAFTITHEQFQENFHAISVATVKLEGIFSHLALPDQTNLPAALKSSTRP